MSQERVFEVSFTTTTDPDGFMPSSVDASYLVARGGAARGNLRIPAGARIREITPPTLTDGLYILRYAEGVFADHPGVLHRRRTEWSIARWYQWSYIGDGETGWEPADWISRFNEEDRRECLTYVAPLDEGVNDGA